MKVETNSRVLARRLKEGTRTPMLELGQPLPNFRLESVDGPSSQVTWFDFPSKPGRWQALIYYPRDFSFVCPTELLAFSSNRDEFEALNCDLLGVSIDSLDIHREWLAAPLNRGGVAGLGFPLASDPQGKIARRLGLWNAEVDLPHRALLLIDPDGCLQYLVVHHMHVGRNVEEVLRVLNALQTEGLCPASWTDSEGTLNPEEMLEAGRVLGHYRITERMGSGTFGSVFSAWDLRLQRQVALKILKRTSDQARSALLDEARAAASINHPFVCTIYSVEEHDHLPVIVMQYVDGGSLANWLSEARPLDAATARRLVRQIAEGLATAHEIGVVHGDLKPANVLMDAHQKPVIVDFGMAASHFVWSTATGIDHAPATEFTPHDSNGSVEATASWDAPADQSTQTPSRGSGPTDGTLDWNSGTQRLLGTPAYMSPEQSLGKHPTPLSDIFSLGLIYAEMLSGKRVLDESQVAGVIQTLRSDNLSKRVQQRLGERFPKSCLAMLQPDPADRPTARQIVAALG